MRPALALAFAGVEFSERDVEVTGQGFSTTHQAYSPNGLVPCLHDDGGVVVWDSLAICEYAYDALEAKAIWPADVLARTHARCVTAEMHAGFPDVRGAFPMNLKVCCRLVASSLVVDAAVAAAALGGMPVHLHRWQRIYCSA